MLLSLINPGNPLLSLARAERNRRNRYRVWNPPGLLVLAGLTPCEGRVRILDENRGAPGDSSLPHPDQAGIAAFTSRAPRAYPLAAETRGLGPGGEKK